jgi:hypothetical protein
VQLLSQARLLADLDPAPAVSWVTQRNPWAPNDIATFLRFDGLSAGVFLSVANPWGAVDLRSEGDACLQFENRFGDFM